MPPKRPRESDGEPTGRERKKQRISDARAIDVQPSNRASHNPPQLPTAIDVVKFTEARAFEIQAMQKAMKSVKSAASTRVWQTLPRHLRRRAASHDVRRVPVRLREKARLEMDPVKKKALKRAISKPGKNKQMTRTQILLRRQRDKKWLETHIWHAKRMKMNNIWGYRLAEHSTEKSFRPSHRAAIHGCILHDASYTALIELKGKQSLLRRVLNGCSDPHALSPGAAIYIAGGRACYTSLYEDTTYPLAFIAPIQIIWKPVFNPQPPPAAEDQATSDMNGKKKPLPCKEVKPTEDMQRTLWLRIHPGAYDVASSTLTRAAMRVLAAAKESGEPAAEIEIADLRGHTNTFELTGPKSSQVIRGVMKLVSEDKRKEVKELWNRLEVLQSPGSVPRGMIIGLKVNDPRLTFPPKNAMVPEHGTLPSLQAPFRCKPGGVLAASDLWSEKTRLGLARPRFMKKELDERRAKQLIPGKKLAPLAQDDRVPLLLIQNTLGNGSSLSTSSSAESSLHMHGWTILTPLGWGMPFLSSLVHSGSRVGGQRERKSQAFESGVPHFPDDFPGTAIGQLHAEEVGSVKKAKWERTPPAKRVPYVKLGTRSPWLPDWEIVCGIPTKKKASGESGLVDTQRIDTNVEQLVPAEVSKEPEGTGVWLLRHADTKDIFDDLINCAGDEACAETLLQRLNAARVHRGLEELKTNPELLYKGALVQVTLTMCQRGDPEDMACIYFVGQDECKYWQHVLKKAAQQQYQQLCETVPSTEQIIGYLTTGRMSLSRGIGFGIGSVSLAKLVQLARGQKDAAEKDRLLVKIRNRDGVICRPARMELCVA